MHLYIYINTFRTTYLSQEFYQAQDQSAQRELPNITSYLVTNKQNMPGHPLLFQIRYSQRFYMHLHPCMLKAITLSNILRQSVERQAGSLQQTICTSNHLHNTTALAPLLRHAQPQVSHPKGESLHNTYTLQMTALSPTVSPLQSLMSVGKSYSSWTSGGWKC